MLFRNDPEFIAWLKQQMPRRRTQRQIAYLDRQIAQTAPGPDRDRLESERTKLAERYR